MFLCVDLDASKPKASKGAAVLIITALWWFTEVLPLTITSLLPMVLYPLLGVVRASELSTKFFGSTSFLFIAGFFIGLAVERWTLHERIVCTVVSVMGRRVEMLIAGFMLSVWLLSMWISNTATILCMLPMAQAFLATLPPGHERFQSGFLLAIGYSATIGGIATPVGTPTNGIFIEQFSTFWPSEDEFSFAKFVLCAIPLSAVLLVTVWLGFCSIYVWRSKETIPVDRQLFTTMQAEMGKLTFEQIVVAADLLVLIVLWFTASPINSFPGWKKFVAKELNSGSIGLIITLPLFFIPCGWRLPAKLRKIIGEDRCATKASDPHPHNVLDWHAIRNGFKWEILFVFGGGMLIAHGTVKSELAQWIAECLAEMHTSEFGFIFVVTLIICSVTEVVSNMSTLATFGSIIATTAQMKGYDQVQLLLAVTFAASFAFMLPMAGGPNMVVYSTGRMRIRFMAMNGLFLNLSAVILGSLYIAFVMPGPLGSYRGLPLPHVSHAA
mmetsp:Transcript_25917/g.53754  ORF Transcript_25917/g.53754 Transcript_25917/m.53754 type:complete len:497 (+) Transcript_25917:263-1753(+)